ncbi:MAG: hypothetical protein IKN04_06170 [Clostridia bacterium]|nr:hypothetical protein [Clostridia bacterium]
MKKLIAALLAAVLTLCCCAPALGENTKHERVYIVAGPDGEIRSLTDSIRLENNDGLDEINDVSLLTGIENMSGDETFTRDGDALIWQAQGNDIIYQGTSDQAPAILPEVSLTLDGGAVTAAELKNKTGEAVLTVTYSAKIDLPALAITLLPLPASGMENLQVENAMIISEAGQRILVGYAVPGADTELQLPDHFTVSFHADHADLPWMMTLISADPIRLACREIDARLDFDPRNIASLASSLLTALKNGEDLPMQPGLQNLKTNIVLGQVNNFFHSLTKLDEDALSLGSSAAGIADSTQALQGSAAEAKTSAGTLQSALNGLQTGGDSLNVQADALLTAAFQSVHAQLAAMDVTAPDLTADNYAEALDAAVQGTDEAAAARIAALKNQLEQTVRFVGDLNAYMDGVNQAVQSADTLNDAVTALTADTDALHKSAAALQKDAGKLQKDGTAKVKSTVTTYTKQLASMVLPYVQNDLTRILDIYEQTRDQVQNGGYDLRPDGMQALTVYIIRTDLQ